MATEKPTEQSQEQPHRDDEARQPPSAAAASSGGGSGVSGGGGGGGPPATKCVYIFRNGDVFAPSKKFVLNRRQLRDWDVFLEQVTLSVNPLRGAVRTIVTPKRGRRRIQDLDGFEDKGHYVALAKGERFKPLTYIPDGEVVGADDGGSPGDHHQHANGASPAGSPRRPLGSNRIVLEPILPVVHNKKLMSTQPRFGAKMDVISAQSKVIRVYRNGDEFTPAIITMLRPSEQASMEIVLRAVEEKVVLPNNMAIRKLYDLSGRRVHDPQELLHEKYYVAGGHEPFMPRPYGQKLPVIVIGKAERTSTIKYLSQPITPERHAARKSVGRGDQQPAATEPTTKNGGGGGGASKALKQQPSQPPHSKAGAKGERAAPTREEQEKSASAIQASVGGFQTRRQVAERLAGRPIDIRNEPANSKAREQKQQQKQQQPKQPMTADEREAARVIQASVNSYKTRKTVAKQQAAKAPPA